MILRLDCICRGVRAGDGVAATTTCSRPEFARDIHDTPRSVSLA
jgi:hypothetical protein